MIPFCKPPVVFGIGEWNHGKDYDYRPCESEVDLLYEFIKYWRREQFDIITGWNVNSFDITYLCNRIDKIIGEGEHKKLSPWGMSDVREFVSQGYQKQMVFNLYGINVLDYLELYRKHTFVNQESYKLDHIAHV